MKPRLLDLFCGAGGCSMGYHRAGFEVVGVDINPQPHYPFPFKQYDALKLMDSLIRGNTMVWDVQFLGLKDFDVIHASPPCQVHSCMTKGRHQDKIKNHANLIPAIRKRLKATGKPYVIENVQGAKAHMIDPIILCGTMFELQTKEGSQLLRHRLFESNADLVVGMQCNHGQGHAIGVYGGGQHPQRRRVITVCCGSDGKSTRREFESTCFTVADRRDAMGIDWMTGKELTQAIPPAYTEYIGNQLLNVLKARNCR